MDNNKLSKTKKGESFGFGLFLVLISITITSIAFMSESNKITGFATLNTESVSEQQMLQEYKDVDSLGTLAPGNYFIDGNGIVYWIDDESKPAIAKVKLVDEAQKNRHIYIDANGNIGYVLS